MFTYWIIFFLAAFFALGAKQRVLAQGDHFYKNNIDLGWMLWIFILLIYIGLRWDVGGDWGSYKWSFWRVNSWDLMKIITKSSVDPGFGIVQWLSGQNVLNWGYHGLNAISAFIFLYGFAKFCKSLPRPYLALVVAIPYLVNVVSMGYMRQSIAIGFAMLAILQLFKKRMQSFYSLF